MRVHDCKICRSPDRDLIESWRLVDGLSYRALQEKAASQLGMKLALGTITKHFQFVTNDVAQAVDSQIKEFVKTKSVDSMGVALRNIELADKVIGSLLNEQGVLNKTKDTPLLVMLMRERRQSAMLVLKYSGARESGDDEFASLSDEELEMIANGQA